MNSSLAGEWRYRGKPPIIRFKLHGTEASIKLPSTPLPHKVLVAFFRFMTATFGSVKPARAKTRGRRRRHRRRYRRTFPKTIRPRKRGVSADEVTDKPEPSAELIKIAQQVMKKGNKK